MVIMSSASCSCGHDDRMFCVSDGTTIDIGRIKESCGPHHFRLAVMNSSNDTLHPSGYRSSCRCISADIDRGIVVAPGTEYIFNAVYNPAGHAGKTNGYICLLYSNGMTAEIGINAEVIPCRHPIEEEHPYDFGEGLHMSHRLLHFGKMRAGDCGEVYFHIANSLKNKADIRFSTDTDTYTGCIRMRQPGRMDADSRDTIHVKFTMPVDAVPGDTVTVRLQPSVDGRKTAHSLTVIAIVQGA